jgi:hypothetical protein
MPLWSLFLIVYLHLQWNAVLTQIILCLAEAVSKTLRRSEKCILHGFQDLKALFFTILILVAGTNSVSSGNIVEESFFDKYAAAKG